MAWAMETAPKNRFYFKMAISPERMELFRRLKKQNEGNFALYTMRCSFMIIRAINMVKMAFEKHASLQGFFERPF